MRFYLVDNYSLWLYPIYAENYVSYVKILYMLKLLMIWLWQEKNIIWGKSAYVIGDFILDITKMIFTIKLPHSLNICWLVLYDSWNPYK